MISVSDKDPSGDSPQFRAGIKTPLPRGKPFVRVIGLWVFLAGVFWALWWLFQRH